MLGGKKRIIVDKGIFKDISREVSSPGTGPAGLQNAFFANPGHGPASLGGMGAYGTPNGRIAGLSPDYNMLGGAYLPYDDVDTLRVTLGRYWDSEFKSGDQGFNVPIGSWPGEKVFDHEHHPINIIFGRPIVHELCAGEDKIFLNIGGNSNEYGGFTEDYIFKTDFYETLGFVASQLGVNELNNTELHANGYTSNLGTYWTYLMKTGIKKANGLVLKPIIKSTNLDPENPQIFFDHYHEAMAPYTSEELLNQEIVGKAFYVNYKPHYGSRTYSKTYEAFIGNSIYQNSLPNIIALAKIVNNPDLAKNSFYNLVDLINQMKPWYKPDADTGTEGYQEPEVASAIRNDTYTNLFQKFPLEASILLYGALAPGIVGADCYFTTSGWVCPGGEIGMVQDASGIFTPSKTYTPDVTLERLLTLDVTKIDAAALFKQYFDNFREALLNDNYLKDKPLAYGGLIVEGSADLSRYGVSPSVKVGALEYINSNLLFGTNVAELLNEVKQYKDYFPMYIEINFTSEKTLLGDKMKEAKITKFLGYEIAAAQKIYGWGPDYVYHYDMLLEDGTALNKDYSTFFQNNSHNEWFVDSQETKLYENVTDKGYISIPGLDSNAIWSYNTKKVIDLISNDPNSPGALDKWVLGESYSSENSHQVAMGGVYNAVVYAGIDYGQPNFIKDVRNYVAYIRNDAEEPYALDNDCNPIFASLFGASFVEHLKSIYNEKARTYSDILNGVPAYTEDLFYIIKKFRKNNGEAKEINVQNIIIPNTSDLNIIEYVDTQVKYGTYATYRYEIHVYRIIFGSKYYYTFPTEPGAPGFEGSIPPVDSLGDDDVLIDPWNSATTWPEASTFFKNITYYPIAPSDDTVYNKESEFNFSFTAKVRVTVEPSIKLIGEEMFSTRDIKILDSPPVPPFVNIVPYRAISNRIKIILDGSTDIFRAIPIFMLEGDETIFNDIKLSQNSADGKIEFSSDDKVANFQTFRIEEKPKSYKDFMLHPNEDFALLETGGSAAFDDSILPNKKYYYTFRTVDNHGHVSNPTPVYEVELIDEKGAVKPIIRTISMEAAENKAHSKELQKYLLIRPTERQIYFSEESDVNSIFSADEKQDSKKKYKMRITSKGTGKKLDINFSFTKRDVT